MRDDAAVSSVLGAILVFGLFVVTLVTIQVRFVPVWDHDREADLMDTVRAQLAQVKSDLDRLADNRTSVPVSDPVTLSSTPGFRFFTAGTQPASLSFVPGPPDLGIRLTSPQLRVLSQGGRPIFGGSETWVTIVSGTAITNVTAIEHLRVRVSTPSAWGTGDSVTFAVVAPGGAYAGKMVVRNIDHGATYSLEYQTYSAQSQTTPISIMQESHAKQNPPPYLYVDLLRSEFLFGDVLRAAPTPFQLQMTRQNMAADYTASYRVQAGDATVQVGNPGLAVPNYNASLAAGSIRLESRNQQFPHQEHILEHGAVLLAQAEGRIVAVAPQMAVAMVAGQVHLTLVVPALSGAAGAVAGVEQATITLAPTAQRTDIVATAARITFTVATAYPSAWTAYWAEQFQAAGLTSAGPSPQFTTTTDATTASFTLFGGQSDPASTVDDIHLTFKATAIQAAVRASGTGG